MASFILRFTQQAQLPACPLSYCKHTSPLKHLKICSSYSPSAKLALEEAYQEIPSGSVNHNDSRSGFSYFSPNVLKVGSEVPANSHAEANIENRVTIKERRDSSQIKRRAESSAFPCAQSNNGSSGGNEEKCKETKMEKRGNRPRKRKLHSREAMLRVGLGMCSKRGDVLSAIRLYELARKEGVKLDQYHYSVLLYICSSAAAPAATGILQSAKSGSGVDFEATSESSSHMENSTPDNGALVSLDKTVENEFSLYGFPSKVTTDNNSAAATLDELVQLVITSAETFEAKDERAHKEGYIVEVSPDVKSFALDKGFEIFELSQSENVPMNEAIFTSAARLSMSLGDGDMAFSLVKRMKEFGINPRLRSYGPALHCFCNSGDVEKAFMVEAHMLESGVCPEEPELEALLKASVEAERSDKVYYVLHKLRTNVRQVSPSTAHVIEKWFHSKCSSRVGKRKWNQELVRRAIENGGGGWHGMGWLGNGKWTVSRTSVGSDGLCKCCGEQLATIDLDPKETENFAQSVASIAAQREKKSNFQKFQKWLDYYGPFEAVVDGANVGLLNQRNFKPSKVNAVANGIRQMFPSKKWPLIILHNRRVNGDKLHKPFEKALIEKWRTADALYETPTGSNDDWYWLYAAIKFKCLLVTNDEMRDHLFQLLGNDFFPKWKERHQVHFSFSEKGPLFQMPPPCSVVIQESEKGHWHIPTVLELGFEEERTWLCVTRTSALEAKKNSHILSRESNVRSRKEKDVVNSSTHKKTQAEVTRTKRGENDINQEEESYFKLESVLQTSVSPQKHHSKILQELYTAEMLGNCIVDFQI